MTEDVDDRDVDDGLELSKEGVGEDGAKDGSEVAEHGEYMVDDGGKVFVQFQFLLEVDGEDGLVEIWKVWEEDLTDDPPSCHSRNNAHRIHFQ